MSVIDIPELDLNEIGDDVTVGIIGSRGSGKTFCARDILYHKRDFVNFAVVSGTEASNGTYGKIIPSIFISDHYSQEAFDKVIERQERMAEKRKFGREGDPVFAKYANMDNRLLILFDDLEYDNNSWGNSKQVRKVMCNGRHFQTFFMVLLQYSKGAKTGMRGNFNYVFLLNGPSTSRATMYETWIKDGYNLTLNEFSTLFTEVTKDHGCLVLTPEGLKRFRASPRGDFRMGMQRHWDKAAAIEAAKREQRRSLELSGGSSHVKAKGGKSFRIV